MWKFSLEQDPDADPDDVHTMERMSRWVGDLAPSGWFGALKGRTMAVYLGDFDSAPEALIVVRYERDNSDWMKVLLSKHFMIVDDIVMSPSVPDEISPFLHAAIVQALVAMGAYHQMDGACQRAPTRARASSPSHTCLPAP